MAIDYSELELAFDFVSDGYGFEHSAYLDKQSGKIYFDSDASEDILPEDLSVNEKYIEIPSKQIFGLGKPLAIEFARSHLSSDLELVYKYFNSRGAYSKFKSLLEDRGLLDTWYTYEQAALKNQILQWCAENEISI